MTTLDRFPKYNWGYSKDPLELELLLLPPDKIINFTGADETGCKYWCGLTHLSEADGDDRTAGAGVAEPSHIVGEPVRSKEPGTGIPMCSTKMTVYQPWSCFPAGTKITGRCSYRFSSHGPPQQQPSRCMEQFTTKIGRTVEPAGAAGTKRIVSWCGSIPS